MRDNVLVIILGIVTATVSSLLVGNVVAILLGPVTSGTGELKAIQRDIRERLVSIEKKLATIEARQNMVAVPANQAAANQGGCGPNAGGGAPAPDLNKVHTIPLGDSAILGKKDAPITIVAFFDLQCPFCNRFYPAVKNVQKAYSDKVKVVIKNYPLSFHPNALPAAKLALAAHVQNKYFEMMELLLENGAAVSDDKIKEYAKKLGLKEEQLITDYKNKDAQWQKQIDADKALGDQVGVRGTPAFYINGRMTQARDLDAYKAEIDKILSAKK